MRAGGAVARKGGRGCRRQREGGGSEGGRKGAGEQRCEWGGKTHAAWVVVHLTPFTLLLLYFIPSPLVTGSRRSFRTASLWSMSTSCSGPWVCPLPPFFTPQPW